jgi:hypothetical protein
MPMVYASLLYSAQVEEVEAHPTDMTGPRA